jgi:aspartyl-tRNA(Asn)/glutamyl-tRNA(Gln) amidotransferase subunit B
MEEGSMRCDANVSIRVKGEKTLGTKVEVKNLNSIRNVKKAIEFEIRRMIDLVDAGDKVIQQTRSYDAGRDITFAMRTKEEANDYRYFPDPDLPPFVVTANMLEAIKLTMPELPEQLVVKFEKIYQLSEYNARVISNEREMVIYFESLVHETKNYKSAANWLIGPVKSYLNEQQISIENFPVSPSSLAKLIDMVESGVVNFSTASSRILPELIKRNSADPFALASDLNLVQDKDSTSIEAWVDEVLSKMPAKVEEYKKGKKGLIGLFMGEVKKISKGKADPVIATRLINEKLSG